jgi:hypothetical protein
MSYDSPIYNQEKAMCNAYNVITKKIHWRDALERTNDVNIYFPFDPENYTLKDVEKVIKYFSDVDDFEKCIELMECCSVKTKK